MKKLILLLLLLPVFGFSQIYKKFNYFGYVIIYENSDKSVSICQGVMEDDSVRWNPKTQGLLYSSQAITIIKKINDDGLSIRERWYDFLVENKDIPFRCKK